MKKLLKNIATPLVASAIIVAGLAGAAATDAIPNPLPNAVAGNVIKATDINDLATAVGILDERTVGIESSDSVTHFGSSNNISIHGNHSFIKFTNDLDPENEKNLSFTRTGTGVGSTGYKFSWRNDDGSPRLDAIQMDRNGQTYFTGGNVGIGTTNPNEKLEVYGNIKMGNNVNITPSASGDGQLKVRGIAYSGYIAMDASAMHIGHNSSGRALKFQVNETDVMTLGTDTKVTIHELSGTGNAFACVTDTGTLYRSATACN